MNTKKIFAIYDLYFCDFVDWMVSHDDAILLRLMSCAFLYTTSRESIQLY